MHNSSAAITALSLDRPVLVPDNTINQRLSDEVGPGWVFRYEGELTARQLVDALATLRKNRPASRPELGGRNWDLTGTEHVNAYRRAISLSLRTVR